MHIASLLIIIVAFLVNAIFKYRINSYLKSDLQSQLSGAEVARKMLDHHGLKHVQITCTEGHLTDHYNPQNSTVNLSTQVYYGSNVASAAVAAHECGHAVQHAHGYFFLTFRSTIVPILSITNRSMNWIILIGIICMNISSLPLEIGIALFSLTTLFSIVTLPVEFDASRRALAWIDSARIVTYEEHKMAKSALWWAAMTYVIAALASIVQLIRLINLLGNRRHQS